MTTRGKVDHQNIGQMNFYLNYYRAEMNTEGDTELIGIVLSAYQDKQVVPDYAGVEAADATFTKAHRDYDNSRQVYEIEFYANTTEYDMDLDVNTDRVTDFGTEYHGVYNPPVTNIQSGPNTQTTLTTYRYYYADPYEYDVDRVKN